MRMNYILPAEQIHVTYRNVDQDDIDQVRLALRKHELLALMEQIVLRSPDDLIELAVEQPEVDEEGAPPV